MARDDERFERVRRLISRSTLDPQYEADLASIEAARQRAETRIEELLGLRRGDLVLIEAAANERNSSEAARQKAESERDALKDALRAVVERWDECLPEVNASAAMAYVHGHRYDGPTMVEPIAIARRSLDPQEQETSREEHE